MSAEGATVPLVIAPLCDVCGKPAKGSLGVCKRAPDCRAEYKRRWRASKSPRRAPSLLCEVCGKSVRNDLGVCADGTAECRREYDRRWRSRNQDKIKQRKARYRAGHQAEIRECRRRYRATHPDEQRRSNKPRPGRKRNLGKARQDLTRYLQRVDRPCKLSKAGCAELAVKNSRYCREHRAEADKRRIQRRARKLRQNLAAAQAGLCPWCALALPGDLRLTDIDHIIPQTRGGPDEPWNWQLLHRSCNGAKANKITPDAQRLAVEHGIAVAA